MTILIVLVALAIINKNRRVDTYTVSYYKRAKVVTASCKITYYCTCYCSINVFRLPHRKFLNSLGLIVRFAECGRQKI